MKIKGFKSPLLYFSDGTANSADDAFVAKAENFLSMEIAGTSTVKLSFVGSKVGNSVDTATLTLDTALTATGNKNGFRDACAIVAGILNADSDKMYVVADELNSKYIAPFTGTVTVANA